MIIIYRLVLKHENKELYRQPILACETPEEALKAVEVYGSDGFHFLRLEIVDPHGLNYISKDALASVKAWINCRDGKAQPGEKKEPEGQKEAEAES
jgi:hypothetical protein